MAEEKIKIAVCSALIPVFYQNFHCLAQDCRDSCCIDWGIYFDKKDYLRLRRLNAPPALRERLERGVRREKNENRGGKAYAKFDLDSNNGRCPFLDEDNLCAIQRACGHDALPHVCTSYPRMVGYSTAAKEHSLSPSCEGVLQQLWDLPEGVEFVENPLPKSEWRNATFLPDEHLLAYFAPVRAACIDILQNRAMPLTERMLCLGVMIRWLLTQNWVEFDLDEWEKQAALLTGPDAVMKMDIPGNRDMYLAQNLNVLKRISAPGNDWAPDIDKVLGVKWDFAFSAEENDPTTRNVVRKVNFSTASYADALAQFKAVFSDREYFFENLMVAAALYLNFPKLGSKESLWKNYVSLCNLYSFYRFVSVLGCKDEPTKERLFHLIVMSSREILHSVGRLDKFQEHLFKHDSSTLAHMAILLRWD